MEKQEREGKPLVTKFSEEARNAIKIAETAAYEVRKDRPDFHYYIEPSHLAVGLIMQPSVRELLAKRGITSRIRSLEDIKVIPLMLSLEFDDRPESGIDGGFSERSKMATTFASLLAEHAGRQEISATDMVHGIILEDQEESFSDPPIEEGLEAHESRRLMGKTAGSFLESVIGVPFRRTTNIQGKTIVSPLLYNSKR